MSSFVKRSSSAAKATLKGTQPALLHGDLRVSTGVASLDHLLGEARGLLYCIQRLIEVVILSDGNRV
jgi:hypothetical protein